MDLEYFKKIQNAYGTNSKRERELANTNTNVSRHFEDTYDTEEVLINNTPMKLMIVHDTESNTYKRKIKSLHEDRFNLGDYIIWNDQVWIVTVLDVDDKTWNRGYMCLCTVALCWQNKRGEVIRRYGYSEDFTKYSSGIYSNNYITVGDNQYGITLPVDEETKHLKRDMRFAIDYPDVDEPDVYKLSNRKTALSNYGYFNRGAILICTVTFSEFNKQKDKLVTTTTGEKIWICDYNPYIAPSNQTVDDEENVTLKSKITGSNALPINLKRKYTANFTDNDGNTIDYNNVNFAWNMVGDFFRELTHEIDGNTITFSVSKESLIGNKFKLQLIVNNSVADEKEITVSEVF